MNDFMAREFWRFVQVQQTVAAAAQSPIEFPPMQQAGVLQPHRHQGEGRGDDEEPRRAINRPRGRARRARAHSRIYNLTARGRGRRICKVIYDTALLTFRRSLRLGMIEGECVR